MANNSRGRFFVKNTLEGNWEDLTTKFDGLAILSLKGMLAKGKAVNVYTAQWIDDQEEDFLITTLDENQNPVIIRENIDIELSFVIKQKYATTTIDVQQVHDNFIEYMTGSDVWLKSSYMGNRYVHCINLDNYTPSSIKLDRGVNSYVLGNITFHCLEAPQGYVPQSYTLVQNPSGNPKSLGYYEREGTTSNYRLTWDTSVVSGKSYYTKD